MSLEFGIAFQDESGNEYYGTVYRSLNPTPLYAVHFFDERLRMEYDVLVLPVVNDKFVTRERKETSIPNISELCAWEISKYLEEHNLSIA